MNDPLTPLVGFGGARALAVGWVMKDPPTPSVGFGRGPGALAAGWEWTIHQLRWWDSGGARGALFG